MARCYADENFPHPVVDRLRRLGHDILTMTESGHAGQAISDPQVVALATAEQRVLLTLNRRHFIRLHHKVPDHAGIVVCSFDPDFNALAGRIHELVEANPQLAGQLLRVNRPAT